MNDFYRELRDIYSRGASRVFALTGNINDVFFYEEGQTYLGLVDFLKSKAAKGGFIPLVYELNGPIRCSDKDKEKLKDMWTNWRKDSSFDEKWTASTGRPHYGLEFLRQLCIASRETKNALTIIIEATDAILPNDYANIADRRAITICRDWFSDPSLLNGNDVIVFITESMDLINSQIRRIPYVSEIEIALPSFEDRKRYIPHAGTNEDPSKIASMTAGLNLIAIHRAVVGREKIDSEYINKQIELYIKKEIGDDVIEFKRPSHTLNDVIGNTVLKRLLTEELIPRLKATGDASISGAAVSGPIGSGKTFIFEAVASELGCPVITLKNIRSKYFGETDVIFNRLRRCLESMGKILVFVDEADTQFGKISSDAHETERRLTGKIQEMMSDSKLRGKITWLLMTARIHLLSPDIRRPGRVGDLIIPVFDPIDEKDKLEFAKWALKPIKYQPHWVENLVSLLGDYSAASYVTLRSEFASKFGSRNPRSWDDVYNVVLDIIPPDISKEREYQTLQALLNCTRKSLIQPFLEQMPYQQTLEKAKEKWRQRIKELEDYA